MIEETIQDVEGFLTEYNQLFAGDLSKLDMVSESFSFHFPLGDVHGRDELEETIEETTTAFPDTTIETVDYVVGDELLMYEFTFAGTHEGQYEDMPPTGHELEINGMAKLVFDAETVTEDHTYFDAQEWAEQLGMAGD